jgi:hypothetical protein
MKPPRHPDLDFTRDPDAPYDARLEARIHAALSQLPPVEAPLTLIPRVLAAIHAHAHLPWWKRSWPAWPRSIQCGVLSALVVSSGAIAYGVWVLNEAFASSQTVSGLTRWLPDFGPLVTTVSAIGRAGLAVVQAGNSSLLWVSAACLAAAYLTCVALGTVCYRLAANKI